MVEELARPNVESDRALDFQRDLCRQQRVPASFEEVVVYSDLVKAKCFCPYLRE